MLSWCCNWCWVNGLRATWSYTIILRRYGSWQQHSGDGYTPTSTCISLPTSVICALITFDTQQKIVSSTTLRFKHCLITFDTKQKVVSSTTLRCDLLSNIALITFDIQLRQVQQMPRTCCDLLSNIALITFDIQRPIQISDNFNSCDLLSNLALTIFDTQHRRNFNN